MSSSVICRVVEGGDAAAATRLRTTLEMPALMLPVWAGMIESLVMAMLPAGRRLLRALHLCTKKGTG
jgi:hypothetical protein